MVAPGLVRYLIWGVGAVVLLWHATDAPRARFLMAHRDPFRRAGEPEILRLTRAGIEQDLLEVGTSAHPWNRVIDAHFDDDYLYLALQGGEILGMSLDPSHQVEGSASTLTAYVRKATGSDVSRIDPSLRSRLHDTQSRRARYVGQRPGLVERVIKTSGKDQRAAGQPRQSDK